MRSTSNKWINLLLYFSGIILIVIVWTILSISKNNLLYPSIVDVIKDIGLLFSDYHNLLIILYTILKLIGIIVCSYIVSIILGILAYKFKWVRKVLSPIMAIMRSLPVASLIIILILLIGLKYSPLIITLFVIVPIGYENIYASLNEVDKDIIDEVLLNSNINLNIIFKVLFPIKKEYIISGVLQTLGLGLKVLVMSEILTQGENTIGGKIQLAKSFLDVTRVLSWTVILLLLVCLIELIINYIQKKLNH